MRNTIDDVGIVSCELPQDFHTLRAATKESDHHQDFLQPRTFLLVLLPPSSAEGIFQLNYISSFASFIKLKTVQG